MEDKALWNELADVLKNHIKTGDDVLETVNRLLRKNQRVKELVGTFQLSRDLAVITAEKWDLPQLVSLLHASQDTALEPHELIGAIPVVRGQSHEFLVDGRRRINQWKHMRNIGPHRVLVVSERRE